MIFLYIALIIAGLVIILALLLLGWSLLIVASRADDQLHQ